MNPVVLEGFNRLLLFIHLVAGITCVASSVHLLLRSAPAVWGRGAYQPQVKLHAVTLSCGDSEANQAGNTGY